MALSDQTLWHCAAGSLQAGPCSPFHPASCTLCFSHTDLYFLLIYFMWQTLIDMILQVTLLSTLQILTHLTHNYLIVSMKWILLLFLFYRWGNLGHYGICFSSHVLCWSFPPYDIIGISFQKLSCKSWFLCVLLAPFLYSVLTTLDDKVAVYVSPTGKLGQVT